MSAKKIKPENLCLMEEGHCMRTQVLQLCEYSHKQTENKLNFEYKAGSIDSLLKFVKTNKATTLLPYLATTDFSKQEKTHLSQFTPPVPYRTVGLVVHRHFVKKKLLNALQNEIIGVVSKTLPKINTDGEKLKPFL